MPRVVIVGGGFGGLFAARRLAREPQLDITLVDRQNYHLFQPLLYQVATAGLSPSDIATPIRALLQGLPNVRVVQATVQRVDLALRRVEFDGGAFPYDFLVVAAGVRHAYFGHDGWEAYAPGLKTLDDALEIRRRVLTAFEAAELETDPARRAAEQTFVVVGGGPTGVELAGAIAELARFTVAKDFRSFDPRRSRVLLVEAGPRLLTAFDPRLSADAQRRLEKLGVEVRLSARVTQVDAAGVEVDGVRWPAKTVLWAAGVAASPLSTTLGVPLDRAGRVVVADDLSLPGHPEAFVVGDLAAFTPPGAAAALPGLAPVAMQQGTFVAERIAGELHGRARRAFRYRDKGIMATVGRAAGIAQTGRLRLTGFVGWLAWLFIHLIFLIGFRNRVVVLFQWAWAWFTYGRSARLITGTTPVPPAPEQVGPKP
jgi:NADH dehydrogenase